MRANTIGFGCYVNGVRVNRTGYAVKAGKRVTVVYLADGTRREYVADTWVESASRGRRDLAAGPVRPQTKVEIIRSIRESKQLREEEALFASWRP